MTGNLAAAVHPAFHPGGGWRLSCDSLVAGQPSGDVSHLGHQMHGVSFVGPCGTEDLRRGRTARAWGGGRWVHEVTCLLERNRNGCQALTWSRACARSAASGPPPPSSVRGEETVSPSGSRQCTAALPISSFPAPAETWITSPSVNSPARSLRAMGSTSSFWIRRFKGRAP